MPNLRSCAARRGPTSFANWTGAPSRVSAGGKVAGAGAIDRRRHPRALPSGASSSARRRRHSAGQRQALRRAGVFESFQALAERVELRPPRLVGQARRAARGRAPASARPGRCVRAAVAGGAAARNSSGRRTASRNWASGSPAGAIPQPGQPPFAHGRARARPYTCHCSACETGERSVACRRGRLQARPLARSRRQSGTPLDRPRVRPTPSAPAARGIPAASAPSAPAAADTRCRRPRPPRRRWW